MKDKDIRDLLNQVNRDGSSDWLDKCLSKFKLKDQKILLQQLPAFVKSNPSYNKIAAALFKKIKDPKYVVYLLHKAGEVIYIGKSKDVVTRLHTHLKDKDFDSVSIVDCANKAEQKRCENILIDKLRPTLNKHLALDVTPIKLSNLKPQPFTDWLNSQTFFTMPKTNLLHKLGIESDYRGYIRCMSYTYSCAVSEGDFVKRAFSKKSDTTPAAPTIKTYNIHASIEEACDKFKLWGYFKNVTHSTYKFGGYYITDNGKWRKEGSSKWYTGVDIPSIVEEVRGLNDTMLSIKDGSYKPLPLWFGKYKGRMIDDIKNEDPDYYKWACNKFKEEDLIKMGVMGSDNNCLLEVK